MDLIQNPIENAASLAKDGKLSTPNYFGAIYLLYDSEDHLIRQFSPSNSQGSKILTSVPAKKNLLTKHTIYATVLPSLLMIIPPESS